MNLAVPILNRASREPDRIAISHGQRQLTYSQLIERAQKIAYGLRKSASTRDKIVILSGNRIEFAEVFIGAVYAGYVPVLLDPAWNPLQVNQIIRQCQPKAIFCEQRFTGMIAGEHSHIERFVFPNEQPGNYEQWLTACKPDAVTERASETLFIGFTSGTTGVPKGYMRSHDSWIQSFEVTNAAFQLDIMEHVSAPGPFVHSLSLFALVQSLYSGATFHILQKFDAAQVLALCSAVPNMIMFVVPSMIDSLLQSAVPGTTSIRALISSGGTWSKQSKRRCRQVFAGAKLYEYYGSSEASYISYMDVTGEEKAGSLGRPFDGVEISIRDEQFQEVPAGTTGQLYVRSAMIFDGYYQLPDETKNVFQDGWLRTGDYMYTDGDHYLYLAGRSQNMIKTGGLKVFPEEVEAVLRRMPNVREAMVCGTPHDHWGEQVTAIIQWRDGQPSALEEVKRFCANRLPGYKTPKELITVDEFIYTNSGKVARRIMIDHMKRVIL
ncbi:class I adenylate-forming enzyme family protein [Paenibacillus protaetiae]|uniref:Acyl-CoA synthetase n=1 Tax=Paenibacillus protaetiae TaxID=2509456 RepID=A0A4P6EVV6_9BACL|nr:AMP-binding protein [Paenibacillus protaetiae]QAY65829.1 acyl-CoA synthetase [Paenibacillus protaetiae]